MSMNAILETIKDLSYSQGFYGRLLRSIMELKKNDIEEYERLAEYLEGQNFKDALEMVLFFEC